MTEHEILQKRDEEIIRQKSCKVSSGFTVESLRQCILDAEKVKQTAYKNAREILNKLFENYEPNKRYRNRRVR